MPPPDGDTNSVPGDTNIVSYLASPPWTTNSTNLFLEMVSASSTPDGVANLVLHNSRPNHIYYLVSTDNLTNTALTNWTVDRMFLGAAGTNTPVSAFIKGRTNQLFFAAMTPFGDGEYEDYSVVVRIAGSASYLPNAYVNGSLFETNYPFGGKLVGLAGTVNSLNLGFDGVDWTGPRWSEPPNLDFTQDIKWGLAVPLQCCRVAPGSSQAGATFSSERHAPSRAASSSAHAGASTLLYPMVLFGFHPPGFIHRAKSPANKILVIAPAPAAACPGSCGSCVTHSCGRRQARRHGRQSHR